MCTVTWLRQPDGYVLFCNRDERHTRRPASDPRINSSRGVSFIAPVDGDHGGSWIGANEFGLTLCLLNRYGESNTSSNEQYTSRGLLLTDLFDCRDGHEVSKRVAAVDLRHYRPFTLLGLSTFSETSLAEWSGHDLKLSTLPENLGLLTSTSLNNHEISSRRRQQFEELRSDVIPEALQQFHRSHVPEGGAYSVCMHRDDASTVSLSQVTVRKGVIEFAYTPGPPCLVSAMD